MLLYLTLSLHRRSIPRQCTVLGLCRRAAPHQYVGFVFKWADILYVPAARKCNIYMREIACYSL